MSHAIDRYRFIEAMRAEGVPQDVARLVLRDAATHHRQAELACSSEAADRDRVACPAESGSLEDRPCLCSDYGSKPEETDEEHGRIPRHVLLSERCERRLIRRLAPFNVTPNFQGDPRGCTVKLKVPSGRTDDWGQVGLCVPVRG